MSDEALRWAIGAPVGGLAERDVLLDLAERHEAGKPLKVSMIDIGRRLNLGVVPLYAALRKLQVRGLISAVALSELCEINLALSSEVSGAGEGETLD